MFNENLKKIIFLLFILIFLFSCTSTTKKVRKITDSTQFSKEEYEIYNFLSNEVNLYNEIKIRRETQNLYEEDINEFSNLMIQISLVYVIIGDYTTLPSFNENMSAKKNYSRIRKNLISSFGKSYKDVISSFIKNNSVDYKLNEYFNKNTGKNIMSFSEYLERKDSFPQDINSDFISFNTYFNGPLILSRIGFNQKKDIALIEYELYGNIDYILLKKYDEWKVEKIVVRRIVQHFN
jgi:hypothetical protein